MIETKKTEIQTELKQSMSFGEKKEKPVEEEKVGFGAPKKSSVNLIEDAKSQIIKTSAMVEEAKTVMAEAAVPNKAAEKVAEVIG